MPQTKRIRKIQYDRIDRVEAGAQPGAHVTLVKRRKTPITKEQSMPKIKKSVATLDLSTLDDETRAEIEAALTASETLTAENEKLLVDKAEFEAAVAAASAATAAATVDDDDDDEVEDLATIEGIEKALKKSRSPEMKRILKATLTRVQKAEKDNAELREATVTLQKAERVRIFKARAAEVPNVAPHAASDDEKDGIVALAKMLETIDDKCGADTAEAVEAMLKKAQTQIAELTKPLLKSVGRSGGEGDGAAVIIGSQDDPDTPIAERVAELRKAKPELSKAQAEARVLKDHPELYAQAIAR